MIKKFAAILLSLLLAAGTLSACGSSEDSSTASGSTNSGSTSADATVSDDAAASVDYADLKGTLTIDGSVVDTAANTLVTVNGHAVPFDEYRYLFLSAKADYEKTNATSDSSEAQTDAQKKEELDSIKSSVLDNLKQEYAIVKLCEDNAIYDAPEDATAVTSQLDSITAAVSGEDGLHSALSSYFMTKELLQQQIKLSIVAKRFQALYAADGKFYTDADKLKELMQTDQFAAVKHVLISYESETDLSKSDVSGYDDMTLSDKASAKQTAYDALSADDQKKVKAKSKKVAESVLKKAQDGDDFDKLIKDYGWDPGMETYTGGYYITKDYGYIQAFKDEAFKLKVNEISDIVETSYGYHILKRVPYDADYVDSNIDEFLQTYNNTQYSLAISDATDKAEVAYGDLYEKLALDSIK
ncbi:MAG: peptidylprolyl isomerase [Oscillospiraceae bacterium]